jgi:hypothetical protein
MIFPALTEIIEGLNICWNLCCKMDAYVNSHNVKHVESEIALILIIFDIEI